MDAPKPIDGKNKVVVYCHNLHDGRGDYGHMVQYILKLKEILSKPYEIVPILSVDFCEGESSSVKRDNQRQKSVLQEFKAFCKIHDLEAHTIETTKEPKSLFDLREKDQAMIKSHIQKSALCFTIAYGNLLKLIPKELKINHIECKQLTSGTLNSPLTQATFERSSEGIHQLPSASMGLLRPSNSTQEKSVYGLRLEEAVKLKVDRVKKMYAFKSSKGKLLIEKLVGKRYTTQMIEDYFETYKLMPGYPQNAFGATHFLLTGLLKNMDEGILQKNCDFFVPKGAVEVNVLTEMLKKFDIHTNVTMVTPETEELICSSGEIKSQEDKTVRIFSGFYLDDQEIKDIMLIRNDIGMGSGDNTILQVLSSSELPYFQQKDTAPGLFLEEELLYTIEYVFKEQISDPVLQDDFDDLIKYLRLNIDRKQGFVGDNIMLLGGLGFDENQKEYFDLLSEEKSSGMYSELFETFSKGIREMAMLAAKPGTQKAWRAVHERLVKEYDYNQNFKAICNGALYLSHPNPKLSIHNKDLPSPEEFKSLIKEPARASKKKRI
tara:strand:- start:163839 stop:165482 length:1644 start_codon:yes stop_codon:yes gene_type:complete